MTGVSEEAADRAFLRHAVATLAYRGGKTLRAAPTGFETFRAAAGSRSAGEILAHLGDLFDWTIVLADGRHAWTNSPPLAWEAGSARFFDGLARIDARLASGPTRCPAGKLFQGPIADAFTHVGQIAMLRRLAGSPVRGENYFRASISPGRVGPEQLEPGFEFD
ncbi:MAG TPA: hypothetical protein VFL12_11440 [Thermoanaerobaculia bacterium]|nr:hypothetical protein [Thermoanaerobaculia bacterium]